MFIPITEAHLLTVCCASTEITEFYENIGI